MKTIDLKIPVRSTGERGIHTRGYEWWLEYLAYVASTPRNWIECRLEPAAEPSPNSPVRIIDTKSPEELGVASGYPTAGLSVWWVILCLDGAPERMSHEMRISPEQPASAARNKLGLAEDRFRFFIAAEMDLLPTKPAVQVLGNWRDGEILGYESQQAANDLIHQVADTCAIVNARERLPWNRQFHVRAGIGRTVRKAFSGLINAQRDQLCCIEYQSQEVSGDSIMWKKLVALPA